MPRLVLFDDDGRELFAGDVSRSNVEIIARFLRRNMPALRAAAIAKQAVTALLAPLFAPGVLRKPPPLRPAPAPPRRRVRR